MHIELAHPHQIGDVVSVEFAEWAGEAFFAPATDMLAIQKLGARERCPEAFGEPAILKLFLFLAVVDVIGKLQFAGEKREVLLQHFELERIELAMYGIERGADTFPFFETGLALH